jgi:hypothetical protein
MLMASGLQSDPFQEAGNGASLPKLWHLACGAPEYYPSIIYIKLLRKVIESLRLAILIAAGVSSDTDSRGGQAENICTTYR